MSSTSCKSRLTGWLSELYSGLNTNVLAHLPSCRCAGKFTCSAKFSTCPIGLVTWRFHVPLQNLYLPTRQVNFMMYPPWPMFYLGGQVGQPLMFSPATDWVTERVNLTDWLTERVNLIEWLKEWTWLTEWVTLTDWKSEHQVDWLSDWNSEFDWLTDWGLFHLKRWGRGSRDGWKKAVGGGHQSEKGGGVKICGSQVGVIHLFIYSVIQYFLNLFIYLFIN